MHFIRLSGPKSRAAIIHEEQLIVRFTKKEYEKACLLSDRGYKNVPQLLHTALVEGLRLLERRESGEE